MHKTTPEAKAANRKAWREVNRDRINAQARAWAKANPEKTKMYSKRVNDRIRAKRLKALAEFEASLKVGS